MRPVSPDRPRPYRSGRRRPARPPPPTAEGAPTRWPRRRTGSCPGAWRESVPGGAGGGRCLGVVGEPLPVADHARLAADDPGVVAWRDHHQVADGELLLAPVVHDDPHLSGDDVPGVGRLAAVGTGDRFD